VQHVDRIDVGGLWARLGSRCASLDAGRIGSRERIDLICAEPCAECGVYGCSPVGWVSVARAGELVIAMPVFGEERSEMLPPTEIERGGAALIAARSWVDAMTSALEQGHLLSYLDHLPELTGPDLVRIVQWEAPHHVCGVHPAAVRVDRDRVVAASHLERAEALQKVDALLRAVGGADRAKLEPADPADEDVVLYVEGDRGTVDWRIACARGDRWLLSPAPGYVCSVGSC
jgi:hypothetical protein